MSAQILQPLAGDSPVGPDLRHVSGETIYSRLSSRMEEDQRYRRSSEFEGAAADWRAVVREAQDSLTTESKDMEVATWLTRGLYRTAGLAGLNAGLLLIQQLQEKFWETLHPTDLDVRRGRLGWLEDRLVEDLTETREALPAEAGVLRRTRDQGNKLVAVLKAWIPAMQKLYGKDAPDLARVLKELQGLVTEVTDRLAQTNEPMEVAEVPPAEGDAQQVAASAGPRISAGPARSREDALRQLDVLADYFTAAEPLGPIGPALRRVARWARGSLDGWLAEMIEDDRVLQAIYKTLDMKQRS
jgi:type VI secretion system protein ImpA